MRQNLHPKAIQYAAVDMSAAYMKGAGVNLRNARLACDKFHVIPYVVEALDQIRKNEGRADAGKRDQLERARWMRLKNLVNWMEKSTRSGTRSP
jgi:transposase